MNALLTIRKRLLYLLMGAILLASAACSPSEGVLPNTGATDMPGVEATLVNSANELGNTVEEASKEAQAWLAQELGVSVDQIQIESAEQAEWPNACLGLPKPDESCADVVTPGWRLVIEANGKQYEVRANQTATTVRWQEIQN